MSSLFRRKSPTDPSAPTSSEDAATAETAPVVEDGATSVAQEPEAPTTVMPAATGDGSGAEPAAAEGSRRFGRRRQRAATPRSDDVAGTGLDLPAGTDLDKLVGSAPTTRRRGRLRRRLRHLRSVREVLLRDLGGLVFEARRAARDGEPAVRQIVETKLTRLSAVDAELRDLEGLLDDRRGLVVREPGISGTCPSCGELHGSDARFCWACGTPVAPGVQRPPAALVHVEGTAVPLPPPPIAAPAAAPPPPPPPPPPAL